ncbi:MAG: SpoIIIAH-like family protein [Clostridia bacterium]|nr:SpoIIIAH-like family protein [Clostridia bacterium]
MDEAIEEKEEQNDIDVAISNKEIDQAKENIDLQETSPKIKNNEETYNNEYFINSKLERDNMYSQIQESYQKMIDSNSVTAEQKAIAQNEITKINNQKNAIMIAENLIKTKGFKNVVILINGENVNVIVASEELQSTDVAQIQNIISRELQAQIENIHIANR